MPQVCLYFQLHQPFRLRDFSVFDLGLEESYFSSDEVGGNQAVFQKVATKSYLPMLSLLNKLLNEHPNFVFTLSCSGVFVEQALAYEPKVITLIQKLVATGRVELLAETYYHSLACLYSPSEFRKQVTKHAELMQELFQYQPRVFRNTELVYDNRVAELVTDLGYQGMLTEAVDRYLNNQKKTQVFVDMKGKLPLLLKHAQLSDDIAFRFSDKTWRWFPLGVDRYLEWLEIYGEDELVNLFMDFETFGEHQWESTGIFDFFEHLIPQFLSKSWNTFVTPSQVFERQQSSLADLTRYDVPLPISWADIDRDLTAWIDNPYQRDCLRIMYQLEKPILKTGNKVLIDKWRKLQTSDHYYYMCTKWAADGDVHAYFSPYSSPHEAYRRFSIVLADLQNHLRRVEKSQLNLVSPQHQRTKQRPPVAE